MVPYLSDSPKCFRKTYPGFRPFKSVQELDAIQEAAESSTLFDELLVIDYQERARKWTIPIQNWGWAISLLYIKFGDRLPLNKIVFSSEP